jgi:hypothetical protein
MQLSQYGRLTWPQYGRVSTAQKPGLSLRPFKFGAFSRCSPSKQKETASERSPKSRQPRARGQSATGAVHGSNTRRSPHTRAKSQRQQVQDKTALEIAANEALFGQTGGGADEPWTLGLTSTSSSGHNSSSGAPWGAADAAASPAWYGNSNTQATATGGDFFARSGNHNPRSGKTGGGNSRRAKGGGDSLPLAGAEAPSMGNYDHLRMPVPHRITGQTQQVSQVATATGTTLPHRMKAAPISSGTGGNNSNAGPYFHHFLERNNSNNSSSNSLLFNPGNSFLETQAPTTTPGKRPRPSNSNSNNGNTNFLSPIGFPSPPSFETDHPLPDFNANWGFNSRNVTKTSSSTSGAPVLSSSAMTMASHSNANATTTSSLSAIGSGLSSPNGASIFAGVDSFLPEYDSTLYNFWSAPSGGVMGYETENDAAQGQQQQVPPPLYMAAEDELKMDYPPLSEFKEFNQDLDSYLCGDTLEAGGPSPTTPLGTSTANGMMKMDHLVTADRRATVGNGVGGSTVGGANFSGSREPQSDRLLAPTATTTVTEYTKREHGTMGLDTTSSHTAKRSRGAYEDSFGTVPASTGGMSGSSVSGGSFRNAPMATKVEPKRAMPSLGSYRSGQSLLMPSSTAASQARVPSSGTTTPTTIVTSTAAAAISDTSNTKTAKRPRSRQCVFPGCQNRARSHQKCKKHGGAHQCVFEGCTKNSQSRGLCIAHGGGSRCKKEGCVRAAQSKGLCKSHGGGESCAVEGCKKKAHLKHLCRNHGGGVRCRFEKCTKWAQRKGWCMAHAKEFEAT